MQNVLVLQSVGSDAPVWHRRCMVSVEQWARRQDYIYRALGDDLFDPVPDWYLAKARGRMPIAADLGRLQWASQMLNQGYDWVIWFDADVLVFAPDMLEIDLQQACTFGQEHWVQLKSGTQNRWEVRKNIHNAFAAFPVHCPLLPFLIDLVLRMMRRVDPDHIAPQMMGPKLLSSLHNLADFDVRPDIGALSPAVTQAVAGDHATVDALTALCRAQPQPLVAVNLCASLESQLNFDDLSGDEIMHRVIDSLLCCPQGLLQPSDLGA